MAFQGALVKHNKQEFLRFCNPEPSTIIMQVLVEIPDNKATFGLEVLRNLVFVKNVKPMSAEKVSLWEDLKEASNEVQLHRQGKIKLKTAPDLLDE